MSPAQVVVYVLTLIACFVFGLTVPSRVTDSALGQVAVALAGGFVIGSIGLAIRAAL